MTILLIAFWFQGHFNYLCFAMLANALLSLVAVLRQKKFCWDKLNDYLSRILQYGGGLFLVYLFGRIDPSFVPIYATAFAALSLLVFKNLVYNLKGSVGIDLTFLFKWIPETDEKRD